MPLTLAADERPPISEIYSVDELCEGIKELIDKLDAVAVEGEIQSVRTSAPGHKYFVLAGARATLKAKMWARVAGSYEFASGDHVIVEGKLDFYPPRGELSITVERLTHHGEGAILAKIEELRRRLEKDGLFAEERKRSIPILPNAIGVICGTDAAVRRDIEAARRARFPGYPIVWKESLVSGASAAEELVNALKDLDRDAKVEVIILARGGGSFDDLIPFNDEALCRAIAACKTPVISAIGHEADVPLCDLVADLRCSTPTRAGLEVIPNYDELVEIVDAASDNADHLMQSRLQLEMTRCEGLLGQLSAHGPTQIVSSFEEQLKRLDPTPLMLNALIFTGAKCDSLGERLDSLGPQAILARGYSIVRVPAGEILTDSKQAPQGTRLNIKFARGEIGAVSSGPVEKTDR